ncbi:hypothetical protein L950_0204845 [Sphingobacterium sp. IITKGP-BTPF85]|nr:isocitrate/isopropylmalate family dehydrogenase [Sphingobacterium sp. IITKGP-BTPF85]KKX51496.1 hypothetical protein L950_0204845 [Sphingobacterium sp. IITKGP-BTPF85]
MKKNILVIPGDGIGQEVTIWGKKVLEKIGQKYGHEFSFDEAIMVTLLLKLPETHCQMKP